VRALARVPVAELLTLGLAGAAGRWRRASAGRWTGRSRAGWLEGRWEGVTAMDRFARERLHAGAWLR
jgi:hypothetical protein